MEAFKPTSSGTEPMEKLESNVRETDLVDGYVPLKSQAGATETSILPTLPTHDTNEPLNMIDNPERLKTDEEVEEEIEVFLNHAVRETDLTDPYTTESFSTNFIDIDTSFSDDDIEGSSLSCSLAYRRHSMENSYEIDDRRSSSQSSNTSNLLKATIGELERALSDTKRLLSFRDEENARLRIVNTKLQHELDMQRINIEELKSQLSSRENEDIQNEDTTYRYIKTRDPEIKGQYALRETIKFLEESFANRENSTTPKNDNDKNGFRLPRSSDSETPCCDCQNNLLTSSTNNVDNMKNRISEQEKEIESLREQLSTQVISGRTQCHKQMQLREKVSKLCDRDISTQLRLKFLRDAFFYYMIDFHADEQIKAILAILEYEDKRHDIIFESHKMRQMGKRFTVTKVSSRCLTFVQEEIG